MGVTSEYINGLMFSHHLNRNVTANVTALEIRVFEIISSVLHLFVLLG